MERNVEQPDPPVTVAVRPATADDVERIAAIWAQGWLDGHLGHVPEALVEHRTLPEFRRRAADRVPTTIVAEGPGGVVGFVVVADDELEQVYVDASARGTTVATDLIGHGERIVAEQHDIAWLAVVAGNARARRFYERCGWHDTGAIDNPAEITGGVKMNVPCQRYEKRVRPEPTERAS